MTARISPLAAAGLLILAGFNAWLISVLIEPGAPDDATVTGSVGTAANLRVLADASLVAKPITAYSQTLAQPIFFKSRAPFVPPPPAPPKPAVLPPVVADPGLVLGGVMLSGNIRKAYLFTKANPKGMWVDEGAAFMGWTVQSVQSTSTSLQQQSRKIELHLYPPP